MKKFLLVCLMLLTMGISGFAQNLSDYVMTTGTDATRWFTLTTTTSLITPGAGDYGVSTVQDIGFTFNFAGTDYTQFSVNSDGNLRLGSTVTGTSYYTTPFSSSNAAQNNPKINMLACDGFLTDSGYVYKEVIGTAPDRVCVIEFATSTFTSSSRNSLLRWQVQLYETTNEIQIVYPSTMPPILPAVARQPGMCVNATNIILIDAAHGAAFYNAGQSTAHIPSGTWPDVDRYYHFTIANCQTPSTITVSNVTSTGADVAWTASSDATDFILEYKPVSGTWDDDAETVNVSGATSYSLTGLDPNTHYDVRVANDCGSEQSNYISTTLHTECVAISVTDEPYFEGFEGYATYAFPDCWTRISGYTSGSTDYPYISNSTTAHSGGGYFLATTNASNPIIMALPEFVEDVSTLRLSFWMKPVGTTNYYGRVDVGVMTDLSDTSTFTLVNSWTAVGIGSTTWTKYEVDFDEITSTGNDYIVIRRVVTDGTSTYGWYFDDVQVMPIPACDAPTQLNVVDATPYSVDLFWNPGEETTFTVYYKAMNETEYSAASNVTLDADSIYTLTNLTPGTSYTWYVSSVCSDGTETPSDPSTFSTTMVPVDLPYSTDFSEESDQNWLLENGTCTNYWTMGSIGDTATALYITNNGTTPGYTITTTSIVTASKLFTVGEDAQFQISFDVNVGGETAADYIKLFFAPPTLTYPAATSAPTWAGNSYSTYAYDFTDYLSASTSTSTVVYKFNLTGGNTVHIDAIMPNPNLEPDANSTAQVVFVWKNDGSIGTQPGPIITNVSVAPVECSQPENLTVTNITSSSADVAWDENDATSFAIEYGPHGFALGEGATATVTDNQTTLTDLTPATVYDLYVKSICSDGSESVNTFMMFQTACVGISTLPQTWDFDNDLTAGTTSYPLPTCWNRIVTAPTTQYPYAYNSSTYAHSGTRSLYFYNYYPNALGILPNIDSDELDIQDLQLSFYARFGSSSSTYIRLDVGVMTDPSVDSTFTLVQSIPITTSYPTDPYVVSFSNYTGNGNYIAFRNTSLSTSTSSTYIYIDDVTLEEVPACSKALYLSAAPDAFSADLTWMAEGEDFDVYYKAASDTGYTEVTEVTLDEDGVFTLTGLSSSTTYTWYVVTNCDDTVYTSATATFTTLCAPYSAPFMEDFSAGVMPNCWERFSGLASDAFAGTAPTATTSGWTTFNNTTVFGNNHPKLNIYGTTYKYWLVTPVIDLTGLTDPALTFNLALTDYANASQIEDTTDQYDDKFMVIISTDAGATWSAANATIWSNDSTADYVYNQISYLGEEVTISLENYAGQNIRIAFYGESTVSNGDNDLHIDNVYVGEAPSCAAPSQLIVSQITQTSAELNWTENGDATSWVVEYDTAGFVPGTGEIVTVNGTPNVTLNNLLDAYTYDVYVSAVCDGGGNSNPASATFRTACLALDQIPQTWNFDGIGTGTSVHPDCWICSNTYSSSTQYPYVYGSNAYSGNADLYFYSSSSTYSLAVLPMVDINTYPINTLQVSFMMRSYTPASVRMVVGVMTDPGDMTTFEAVDTVYNNASGVYELKEVALNNYEGSAPYIALKMINLSSTTYAYVDDVTLDYIPTCPRPTHLTVTDNSLNSVTLSWNDDNASSWEIAYGPVGFDPDSDTADVVSAGTNPFEVLSLNTASTYQFYVRAICSGSDYSAWSDPVIASTNCDVMTLPYSENFDSYVTSSTYSDANGIAPNCWTTWSNNATYGAPHITSSGSYHYVHSGTNSMVFTCSSAGSDAYAALPTFTDQLNTLHLNFWRAMESTTQGTLTVGYVTSLTDLANTFVTVATIPSVGSTSGDTISVDFTGASIPATGNICFHWNQASTFYSCCIDDIEVTSNGAGPVITDPTVATNAATAVEQTTATLNATITNPDGVTISAKGFEWKTTTGGTYTQIAGTGTGNTFTANLTGLTAGTGYTFKAFITFNGTTTYGDEMTFTTQQQGQPTEPSATTADATNVTYNSATLNGSIANPDNVTITAQGFQWKATSAASYNTVNATGTTMTYNLTGLDASTEYTYRAFVTTANGTQYGQDKTFMTEAEPVEPCDVPTGLAATDIQSESITIHWDNAAVLRWNVQYSPVGGTLASATANTNSYTITNLTPLTTYQIQVQAVCEEGNVSEWSPAIEVTTTNLNSYLENNVTLYPNPAKEFVDVRVDGDVNVIGMEVYDVYGKLINTINVIDNTTHINVSGLANGMYFVRVTTEQGMVTKRFVKK